MQACTIGLSINEDLKLEKGKEKNSTPLKVGVCSYYAMLRGNSSPGHTWLSLLHLRSLLPRSYRPGARCLQRYRLLCAYTSKY